MNRPWFSRTGQTDQGRLAQLNKALCIQALEAVITIEHHWCYWSVSAAGHARPRRTDEKAITVTRRISSYHGHAITNTFTFSGRSNSSRDRIPYRATHAYCRHGATHEILRPSSRWCP